MQKYKTIQGAKHISYTTRMLQKYYAHASAQNAHVFSLYILNEKGESLAFYQYKLKHKPIKIKVKQNINTNTKT
jgi:type VI protein secretion system component Hcp